MRILIWSINGIRTLPQYHPWNTLKTGGTILDELGADKSVFKVYESTRPSLECTFALPASYDAFFSFHTSKAGYSGVAIYTKQKPKKASRGLSTPKIKPLWNALTERVSGVDPAIPDLDLASLDGEGRTIVVDFGLFILISTYCPVDSPSPTRHAYKMAYHRLLSTRVRRLIAEGREVVLVGDINVCVAASVKEGFYDHSARRWTRGLFGEDDVEGDERMLVDVVKRQRPDRKAMSISARASNYGARIDYILVTPALLPWINGTDIEPRIQGSDHCPVWVDFKDEIQVAGKTVRLDDRYWEEYSGKQKLLSSFFGNGKGSAKQSVGVAAAGDGVDKPPPAAIPEASPIDLDVAATEGPTSSPASAALFSTPPPPTASTSTSSQASMKNRKVLHDEGQLGVSKNSGKQPQKPKAGQTKLSSFSGSPKTTAEHAGGSDCQDDGDRLDADYHFALEVSAPWSILLAPLQPPLCTIHREPAQGFTVNRAGPNKGKKVFVCARPVGPGYDKGRAERMRAEVDHKWKCDYFKWASDA
ncbi:DNase I-like protein [Athelia psychrophila]|uniref:DNA-(apurinic or apyrimidinic site) endonuclease 2 n=1 Tax=Athelia psychrophila TaxID=1759441 RepID=A0A167WSN4_9AGAM|nr:DNase I-like protein [Fibularhizoctonia sp. CBS 109695]